MVLRMTNATAVFSGPRKGADGRTEDWTSPPIDVLIQDAAELELDPFAPHYTYVLYWDPDDGYQRPNGTVAPIRANDSVAFSDRPGLIAAEQDTPVSQVREVIPPHGEPVMRGYIVPVSTGGESGGGR